MKLISLQVKVLEVFTLPHIVQLDSTGLQVILQSPPGVQVPFFWWGHSQIMVPILPGLQSPGVNDRYIFFI